MPNVSFWGQFRIIHMYYQKCWKFNHSINCNLYFIRFYYLEKFLISCTLQNMSYNLSMPESFSFEKYYIIKKAYRMWKIANTVAFSFTKPVAANIAAFRMIVSLKKCINKNYNDLLYYCLNQACQHSIKSNIWLGLSKKMSPILLQSSLKWIFTCITCSKTNSNFSYETCLIPFSVQLFFI